MHEIGILSDRTFRDFQKFVVRKFEVTPGLLDDLVEISAGS